MKLRAKLRIWFSMIFFHVIFLAVPFRLAMEMAHDRFDHESFAFGGKLVLSFADSFKVLALVDLPADEKGKHRHVDNGNAEFLDKIKNESGLTITLAVIEPEIRIKTDIEAHTLDFVVEDAVAIVEHTVVFVASSWNALFKFGKSLETTEIPVGDIAFDAEKLFLAFLAR